MVYVNIKNSGVIETVDEFEGYSEAVAMIKEYRIADRFNYYYLSQRSTKEWRDSK